MILKYVSFASYPSVICYCNHYQLKNVQNIFEKTGEKLNDMGYANRKCYSSCLYVSSSLLSF